MSLTIQQYLQRGAATSKEIQTHTGLSQAVVSRRIKKMGNSVVTIDNQRPPYYILTCNAFGASDVIPITMTNGEGKNILITLLRPLIGKRFYIQALAQTPKVLLGLNGNGLYDDLPYFMDDLRPQGFIGKKIAQYMNTVSDEFPADPRHWNVDHIGRYLLSNGDDLPGNFKFGEQANIRIQRNPIVYYRKDYPNQAQNVLQGTIPGSSAGGEQPKFTLYNGESQSHVIVKFSPKDFDKTTRRWRDILISEQHAMETLHKYQWPAAQTQLLELEGRFFLESQRFDRTGQFGRISMLSLKSIDLEFSGLGSNWSKVMSALCTQGLVDEIDLNHTKILWAFGHLINNMDMHLGNLSLAINSNKFKLLPVYDMCSMGFAPKGGEITPYEFNPPSIKNLDLEDGFIDLVTEAAHHFWNQLGKDNRISDELKEFLQQGNPIDLMPK